MINNNKKKKAKKKKPSGTQRAIDQFMKTNGQSSTVKEKRSIWNRGSVVHVIIPQNRKNANTNHHPVSLSVRQVSKMGKQPSCSCCHQAIGRDEWHTINIGYKISTQDTGIHKRNLRTQCHYHLNSFQLLTRLEKEQLLSIVHGNGSLPKSVKEKLQALLDEQ